MLELRRATIAKEIVYRSVRSIRSIGYGALGGIAGGSALANSPFKGAAVGGRMGLFFSAIEEVTGYLRKEPLPVPISYATVSELQGELARRITKNDGPC